MERYSKRSHLKNNIYISINIIHLRMNIMLFIYVFSLFIITAPNILFKIPSKYGLDITMLHAIVFTCILYFTYDIVSSSIVEGNTLTTVSLTIPLLGSNNTSKNTADLGDDSNNSANLSGESNDAGKALSDKAASDKTAAESAKNAAESAKTAAERSKTAAEIEKATAERTKTAAESEKTIAETAKTAAERANTTAEEKVKQANSEKSRIDKEYQAKIKGLVDQKNSINASVNSYKLAIETNNKSIEDKTRVFSTRFPNDSTFSNSYTFFNNIGMSGYQDYSDKKYEINELRNRANSLKREYDDINTKFEIAKSAVDTADTEAKNAKSAADAATAALTKAKSDVDAATIAVTNAKSNVDAATTAVTNAKSKVDAATAALAKANAALTSAIAALTKANAADLSTKSPTSTPKL